MTQVRIVSTYSFKIHFDIILPDTSRSSSGFATQIVNATFVSRMYAASPTRLIRLDMVWCSVDIIKVLIKHLYSALLTSSILAPNILILSVRVLP
jgi:hypothetical protein